MHNGPYWGMNQELGMRNSNSYPLLGNARIGDNYDGGLRNAALMPCTACAERAADEAAEKQLSDAG